ncbi:MAG: zf-HC2 domain-containing protein [Melioribacteraceae bacterium]|nr:zf-HC2 domain-containing protein [Melioribacteraceae bacterium]
MNCDDVKRLMDDYLDGNLDGEVKSNFEIALDNCPDQAAEIKLLESLNNRLRNLPLSFEPPKEIIPALTEKLLEISEKSKPVSEPSQKIKKVDEHIKRVSEEERKKTKWDKKGLIEAFSSSKNVSIIISLIVLSLILFYIYNFFNSTSPWIINAVQGTFELNGEKAHDYKAYSDDLIKVDDNSSVKLSIPQEGEILIYGGSSLRILSTKKSSNRINLFSGSLRFTAVDNSPNFEIVYNDIHVIEHGSNIQAIIDSSNNLIVIASKDYIDIVSPKGKLKLANDYYCVVDKSGYIGFPVHINTGQEFKDALYLARTNPGDINSITALLIAARRSDILTLLEVMKSIPLVNREIIYNRIVSLFPPPEGITKGEVLNLDEDSLEKLWFEIEWQI